MLESLYELMGLTFVIATMVSMGLSLTMRTIAGPLSSGRFVAMAVAVNFVAVPAAAWLLTELFSLDGSLATGLILVGLAAGAPGLPKMAEIAKVDRATATSLMVLLIVATIVVVPLALPWLLPGVEVGFWDVASGLVLLILVPLALSIFVQERYPDLAGSAQPYATQVSTISLVLLMVLMVVLNWSDVVGLFGSGGLFASLLLVVVAAGIGFLLGGSDRDVRWVMALGSGQRNIAAAMVVAATNFGDEPDVLVMIVVYSLITLLVMVPISAELGRRAKAASEQLA